LKLYESSYLEDILKDLLLDVQRTPWSAGRRTPGTAVCTCPVIALEELFNCFQRALVLPVTAVIGGRHASLRRESVAGSSSMATGAAAVRRSPAGCRPPDAGCRWLAALKELFVGLQRALGPGGRPGRTMSSLTGCRVARRASMATGTALIRSPAGSRGPAAALEKLFVGFKRALGLVGPLGWVLRDTLEELLVVLSGFDFLQELVVVTSPDIAEGAILL
jgi:hypothetical protein